MTKLEECNSLPTHPVFGKWMLCTCGDKNCCRVWPTNIGTFYQGSGFEPDEVREIMAHMIGTVVHPPVTHECDGSYGYKPEDTECTLKRHSDGSYSGVGCGEPCSWIMGKSGHGNPSWHNVNGERRDPNEPDELLLKRICEWHNIKVG